MKQIYTHIFCKICSHWSEVTGLEENICASCGGKLPVNGEREALVQEIRYYSSEFLRRRKQIWQTCKILTLAAAALGLLTLLNPVLRGPFFIAALMYLTFLPSLFTRPSYLMDANFHAMEREIRDTDKLYHYLGAIYRLAWRTMPYRHLDDRLLAAQRLENYLRQNKRLF